MSLDDSDDNAGPTLQTSSTDERLNLFLARFEEELKNEVAKISEKYEAQIKSYEKKGINPLTKKLIEKATTEQSQAIEKKRLEMETVKHRETDKIKAGIADQWSFEIGQ